MLAQLSFGTWRFLLPDNDPGRHHLWNKAMVADRLGRMRTVLLAIDPVLETWFVSRQRVTTMLKTKP
ncbi:hypothetical protein GCM10009630_05640 [Kribbella jejuensis]|uniref:hypothetical protein n=1 Tax=Kribbella jejuensis TaxID=236068 RepID=UPI00114DDD1A|nr:hypothetical protein [Kribbella jejuensis]